MCTYICYIYFRTIIKEMIKIERPVAVTATTGMASTQLGSGATTLHHWAGIMDGRYNKEKLAELLDNDDGFALAKERVKKAECLVIDEISMLSARTFENVEFVCRYVRNKDKAFGGLQVIYISE